MITLRPYQQELYDKIVEAIPVHKRVLCQAETGFGKSILIGHLANNLPGRTLILTHRIELLEQNSEWIEDLGILTARVKKNEPLKLHQRVIGMAQTVAARFKKYGPEYVGIFDNVIVDEVHMDFFRKVYEQIDFLKIVVGFTATPILGKNEYKTIDEVKFKRKLTLSRDFNILLQGIKTKELIELGYLTQDFNIMLTPPNLDKLISSEKAPDGYTSASLTEVFGTHTSIENVLDGYKKHGVGKKTLIFNPTTKVNMEMFKVFNEHGINCRIYDSVNPTDFSRKQTTDWFQSVPDAVLLNVGVFTTGFSVNDLEVIIYNKATKSLGLYLQSIGRGSRIGKNVFKDQFIVLDMGLNIQEHGKWSKVRDWQKYFKPKQWKEVNATDELSLWECKECGFYNEMGKVYNEDTGKIHCESCEAERKTKPPKKISGKLMILDKPKPPRANAIIAYTKSIRQDANFAFRLADRKIVELFILHDIDPDFFNTNRVRFAKRYKQIYTPIYFAILNSDLIGANKKLKTQLNKTWSKIVKNYPQ